jgi:hypothetical protein
MVPVFYLVWRLRAARKNFTLTESLILISLGKTAFWMA